MDIQFVSQRHKNFPCNTLLKLISIQPVPTGGGYEVGGRGRGEGGRGRGKEACKKRSSCPKLFSVVAIVFVIVCLY